MDDLDVALDRLKAAGYTPGLGPFHVENWHLAYVPVIEKIWLDVDHVDKKPARTKRKPRTRSRTRRTR